MLTSSANQYLRPEYLTPLPTTLDAKKSPLALLAQTCSQIGVDPPSSKSLLAPLDKSSSKSSKSSSESSGREKASPSSHNNSSSASSTYSPPVQEMNKTSSFKPYESCVVGDKSSSPEQQRVSSVHSNPGGNSRSRTPGNGKRCSSNQSASSAGGRAITPQGRKSSTPTQADAHSRDSPAARLAASESRSTSSGSPALQSSKATYSPAGPSASSASQESTLGGFRPSPLSLVSSTSAGATTTTTPSAAAYGLPFPPQMHGLDHLTASTLMSPHLKGALPGHPYLGYTRMKTPSGAEALVPVCRDPYCTGCQLNSHLLAAGAAAPGAAGAKSGGPGGACPAGCAQCDHKPSPLASSPYAAYAHAQLVALAAASQLPYVCNWIGADATYCGKRFANSDELLQHVRSHSPAADSSAAAAAATTAAALSLLSPPGLAPGHPLLSRSYPTPPLSPLASARYHPYGKHPYPGSLSSLGLPLPPPHPAAAGLPPYFSPYSLYAGSRLGAASGMHP